MVWLTNWSTEMVFVLQDGCDSICSRNTSDLVGHPKTRAQNTAWGEMARGNKRLGHWPPPRSKSWVCGHVHACKTPAVGGCLCCWRMGRMKLKSLLWTIDCRADKAVLPPVCPAMAKAAKIWGDWDTGIPGYHDTVYRIPYTVYHIHIPYRIPYTLYNV